MKKHVIIGIAAGISLLVLYAITLVLLQSLEHTIDQTRRIWYWLLPLSIGFGIQMGLFSFMRKKLRERRRTETASTAASGAVSGGSMVACCAHHLTEVLPIIGLSSLTIFLGRYQIFFMAIGVIANIIGITVMLDTIQRLGLSHRLSHLRLNMGLVKKVSMALSIPVALISFFIFF